MIGIVIGTRPELIKLRPVFFYLREHSIVPIRVLYVKQHLAIEEEIRAVDPAYLTFTHVSGPEHIGRTIAAMEDIAEHVPALKLGVVQGDTSSAAGAALAMAYQQIPIVHVEAGLRTVHVLDPNIGPRLPAPHTLPFPEELNRQLISRVASLHLAPTYANEQNLYREHVGGKKVITGNPGISIVAAYCENYKHQIQPERDDSRNIVVATCHRRENWNLIDTLAEELVTFAQANKARVFLVMHPNPQLRAKLARFEHHPDLTILEPQPYLAMLGLLMHARLVVTDSGGIIEEATYLRKRLVVIRHETERPEASAITTRIRRSAHAMELAFHADEPSEGSRYAFGDAESAKRCADEILHFYYNTCFRHE